MTKKIRVAVIGTGNIGSDLVERMLKDEAFEVHALVGRRMDSPGLTLFKNRVANLIGNGIEGLLPFMEGIDGIFDATSAYDHRLHWETVKKYGKWAIDLTPSQVGDSIVPELIDLVPAMQLSNDLAANYSMVTCGGQSSAPLVYALSKYADNVQDVEVSSSIAAKSAGPATRRNIDQYIASTEELITKVSDCKNRKVILVLNPAEPPVMMRTTVQMKVSECNIDLATSEVERIVSKVARYVPGYELSVPPFMSEPNVVTATVKVTGAGYYLPEYAGNLDIINAAAVETAKRHVQKQGS